MSNRHRSKKFLGALVVALVLGVSVADRPVFAQSPPAAAPADPYLWLEDIDGQRSMDWVHRENARSLPVLENDRRFPALLQAALQVAQNRDRLPLGGIQHGYLYNFWQDEDHVRGIWRRATVASYATGHPEWSTLVDVDALAAAEHANWVWEGADCDRDRLGIRLCGQRFLCNDNLREPCRRLFRPSRHGQQNQTYDTQSDEFPHSLQGAISRGAASTLFIRR